MNSIAFVDLEVQPRTGVVADYGCIKDIGTTFHSAAADGLRRFLSGTEYLCGHNLLRHDIRYMRDIAEQNHIFSENLVDTLPWSPLLFPHYPYHKLLKEEKLQTEELNNPLTDAIKAKDLFSDELVAFQRLDASLKKIYYLLLEDQGEFRGFFRYISYTAEGDVARLILDVFSNDLCHHADLAKIIREHPVELAYCLSNIHVQDQFSILPAWVLFSYPETERIMYLLRSHPCLTGCEYCDQALDPHIGLKRYFGYDSFRTFGGQPLQEMAVRDAIQDKSILVIFPTGGGKSITFQVPALMSGENVKGLTVVISPLQSLMKDQVDNLENAGITNAVTINGQLDPIERAESMERVINGAASILYISPEQLRSKTIEQILIRRRISRFVIDEAHCFSAWGQDFRVDYLYIGPFIKMIQEKKNLPDPIPVSCFTATAKPSVVEDIRRYFQKTLGLDLAIHQTNSPRTNLQFKVVVEETFEEKYQELRRLIEAKPCPTIVYVSETKMTENLADLLTNDGYPAKPYHGQMDRKEKRKNQDAFLAGELSIMVATSAFGMGVDKKDVGLVVHFEISDSLEQYIQEAGRAGRDEHITADCYVLFSESDLDKYFARLNQNKINIKEIQQIWKAIRDLTRFRRTVSVSALEIARKAGWDETISDIETRVKAAVAALEESGYLSRAQNMPRIYADSILCRTAAEAIGIIENSAMFTQEQKKNAIRIMRMLIGSRSRSRAIDGDAESRVDYIADLLGLTKEIVVEILNLLRQIGLLADTKDLMAYLSREGSEKGAQTILGAHRSIEQHLLELISEEEAIYNIKALNEQIENLGCKSSSVRRIRTILNFLQIKSGLRYRYLDGEKNNLRLACQEPPKELQEKYLRRQELATFIISYLFALENRRAGENPTDELMVDFSVHDILKSYQNSQQLGKREYQIKDVEDCLFYLSHIGAMQIEGGFLVVYNPMTIRRVEEDTRRRYKKEDYQLLDAHYMQKMQQIHIVGEYARRMVKNYREALQFVDDYFHLNNSAFIIKYFHGDQCDEITRNITPAKFKKLFGELSLSQLEIIQDNTNPYIAVLAGPGSGKTQVLVHKLASLILMEDIKCEQLLMLTFSRAAATEFKSRLIQLINKAAYYVDIKTFHSYCFDLLGKVGNVENADQVIPSAIQQIENNEVDHSRITKTVLVIDEAQDMSENEYRLVELLMEKNEDMRVIAVGDDDQNIYEFRGSSSEYLRKFMREKQARQYELLTNYRSKSNLVDFANQFLQRIPRRLKRHPIEPLTKCAGSIRIVKYTGSSTNNGSRLLVPFVNDLVRTESSGSTCVLTYTNEQALQIFGMLQKCRVPARLIQSNEGFRLSDLVEIRFFVEQLSVESLTAQIDIEEWGRAKRSLRRQYDRSGLLENCLKLIGDFESIHPLRKYKTDFEMYLRESKMEDFVVDAADTILVGTIHKSKGKEFDNVHLMLEKPVTYELKAEENRALYVAITRAKSNLVIHVNDTYFDTIQTENLTRRVDTNPYPAPDELAMQASHKDVHLDYFLDDQRQQAIDQLQSGDPLRYKNGVCTNATGIPILRLSKKMVNQIEQMQAKEYVPSYGKAQFILYWKKVGADQECKVVLPELHFRRGK